MLKKLQKLFIYLRQRPIFRNKLMVSNLLCPCGTGINYDLCCQPFHSGEKTPVTAVALMRSRYTAYVLQNANYLLITWEAGKRPENIDFSEQAVIWLNLEITGTKKGNIDDNKGIVSFNALFVMDGEEHVMNETSRFSKINGHWYYVDGIIKENKQYPTRNSLCLCGSGKKYKRCCGGG